MREVAIVGAGELGGAIAHVLARRDVAGAIRLIDPAGRVAAGKALDISQAAPIEGFATPVTGTNDMSAAAAADVIVIADRVQAGEPDVTECPTLLRQLAGGSAGRVFVCAGTGAQQLVEHAVREMKLPRLRILGTAPEALAAAVRALVAAEINCSPADVALTVAGVPPAHVVVPWSDATVAGLAASRLIDGPLQRRIAARVPLLWPPGPYALASAAARVIESIFGKSRRLATCFVAPDDSAGVRSRCVALPVRLGPTGIVELVAPSLTTHDRVALDNAMML